jgi:hypothetical protein
VCRSCGGDIIRGNRATNGALNFRSIDDPIAPKKSWQNHHRSERALRKAAKDRATVKAQKFWQHPCVDVSSVVHAARVTQHGGCCKKGGN